MIFIIVCLRQGCLCYYNQMKYFDMFKNLHLRKSYVHRKFYNYRRVLEAEWLNISNQDYRKDLIYALWKNTVN